MSIPRAFETEEGAAWDFVARRGFGAVVAVDAATPAAAHVPLLVTAREGKRRIECHVACENPLAGIIAAAPRVLVIVTGPDAYISPDWYVSPGQVPTWTYMAAHVTGTAAALPAGRAEAHVEALSLAFEERLKPKKPWSPARIKPERLASMLRAIVPIEIAPDAIACTFQLGQDTPAADRMEAARMLHWRGGAGERGVAEAMRRLPRSSVETA